MPICKERLLYPLMQKARHDERIRRESMFMRHEYKKESIFDLINYNKYRHDSVTRQIKVAPSERCYLEIPSDVSLKFTIVEIRDRILQFLERQPDRSISLVDLIKDRVALTARLRGTTIEPLRSISGRIISDLISWSHKENPTLEEEFFGRDPLCR